MLDRLSILAMTRYDPHIWNGFYLPTGANRQEAIDFICWQCAEIGLTYTEPATLKEAIRIWSTANQDGWSRIWLAMTENYNPLHNYDRYEEWTDTGSASATGQNTNKVAGFNQSAGMADRDRSDSSSSSSSSGAHSGHLFGNIGVTTSATMLKEEQEVRQLSFYEIICKSFKDNFCVQVY